MTNIRYACYQGKKNLLGFFYTNSLLCDGDLADDDHKQKNLVLAKGPTNFVGSV